jgi:hypothetical protein
MAPEQPPASDGPQDEVLTKADALLRRHRGGGPDAALDADPESGIPTLTELIDEPPAAEPAAVAAAAPVDAAKADESPAPQADTPPGAPDAAWITALQPELERIVAQALTAQLPGSLQQQVSTEVTRQLGDGLNRLRDGIRTTIESVVRETIEVEVKRALRALLKERER